MKNSYLDPLDLSIEQWVGQIYLDEYMGLKGFAQKLVRSELEAEVILSSAFEKLEKKIADHPETFASYTHAKAYLSNIVRYACYDFNKHQSSIKSLDDGEDQFLTDTELLLDELEAADVFRRIPLVMHLLPPAWQEVAKIFFIEGGTMEQAKLRLGKSNNDIRVIKSKALKRLRQLLLGEGGAGLPGEVLFFLLWVCTMA